MRTRAMLVTVVLATVMVASSHQVCMAAIARSTNAFCEYFQELRQQPLNPVQRVVFSLALTRAKVHQAAKRHMHT